MNLVIMSGRICDNELTTRYTQNNTAVLSFRLAVDRRDSSEEKKADFFSCIAWKKTAELMAQYCGKGDKITIRGDLRNRAWEDQEGKKHTVAEIWVNEVEFPSKQQTAPQTAAPQPTAPAPQQYAAPQQQYAAPQQQYVAPPQAAPQTQQTPPQAQQYVQPRIPAQDDGYYDLEKNCPF